MKKAKWSRYNTTKYFLGKLCENNHNWSTTEFSLRLLTTKKCRRCQYETKPKTPEIPKEDYIKYFKSQVLIINNCWIWQGKLSKDNYGYCKQYKRENWAHRVSHILFKKEIEPGLIICHKCDNPPCVNPDHLFEGTHKDNFDDMISKNRESWTVKSLMKKGIIS